jgi:hypothetical protein
MYAIDYAAEMVSFPGLSDKIGMGRGLLPEGPGPTVEGAGGHLALARGALTGRCSG